MNTSIASVRQYIPWGILKYQQQKAHIHDVFLVWSKNTDSPLHFSSQDNDMAMKLVTGMTCQNVKAQGQCMLIHRHLFPDVCKCSCPGPPADARHRAQGLNALTDKSGCSLNSFAGKLTALGKTCCNPDDPDDKCTADGVFPRLICVLVKRNIIMKHGS